MKYINLYNTILEGAGAGVVRQRALDASAPHAEGAHPRGDRAPGRGRSPHVRCLQSGVPL